MQSTIPRRRGFIRLAGLSLPPLTLTLAALGTVFGLGEILGDSGAMGRPEGLILFHAQFRGLAELAVVLFQVLAVAGMCLAHLVPTGWWTVLGRRTFVGAMIGLGMSGCSCGVYGSDFSLVAGATMGVLFVLSLLGRGSTHEERAVAAA